LNSPICTQGRQQRPGARVGEGKDEARRKKQEQVAECNVGTSGGGKRAEPLNVSQQQMGLTCATAAEASRKQEGNTSSGDGDPPIPPPPGFAPWA